MPEPSDPLAPRPADRLDAFGWDEAIAAEFSALAGDGVIPGRIVGVDRGWCDVMTAGGPVRAMTGAASAPDPLRTPCAGDWVTLRTDEDPPRVDTVLPRRTSIVRASSDASSHGQVLAANVDTVAVIIALDGPIDLGRVERLVALAWESGATPVVVLTKADRSDDIEAAELEVGAVAPAVDIVAASPPTGEGMDEVRRLLTGTIALIGVSGAGKSTLGNALLGSERLATGEIREQDGKGRHTTVRRELVPLPAGGVLIDTPGLRSVGLWDAADGLALVFAEIEELAAGCRFRDCAHESEPGCAVQAAVASGELTERRVESYRKLIKENDWEAARSDARLAVERKNDTKSLSKLIREHYKTRDKP